MPDRRIRRRQAAAMPKTGTWNTLREICNRNFNVVTLINLLIMTAYYLIFVTSTAYARQTYTSSLSTAGFTAGIMVIGCLAGRFVTGNLLSFFGCRTVLFAGLVLCAGSIAGFFAVDSLPLLFLQRFCAGFGIGVTGTATGTIVAYVVPQRCHGLGVSLFSMSTALALALGPFLGISLSGRMAYADLMQVNVGIALACVLLFFGLGALPSMCHRHRSFFNLNSYIDPRVVRFSIVALVRLSELWLRAGLHDLFCRGAFPFRPRESVFSVVCGGGPGHRPLTGRLFDARGENVIFYPILLLTALSLILLAYAESAWMLLLAGLVLGMGFGNFQSVGQAVSLSLVSRSRFAQATTTFFIFFDLGIGLGPYLFGFFVPIAGYGGMYQALAFTVLMAVGLYYVLHGRSQGGTRE